MKIALKAEIKEIDKRASEEFGVDELMLMENAGAAVANETNRFLNTAKGKSIAILGGAGNNGGDAFVAARHLLNFGAKCKVFFAGDREKLTNSAKKNLNILENMKVDITDLNEERAADKLKLYINRFADAIVDGLLGTGFHGEMREDLANIIEIVNDAGVPVVAIDAPSGVEADTGMADVAIRADLTVSLGLPKFAHFFAPGADLSGKVVNSTIGIPSVLLTEDKIKSTLIDDDLVKNFIAPRSRGVYKGSVGRVLTLAGSEGMTGAALLSSKAALKAGAGLSTLATGRTLQKQLQPFSFEVMTKPVEEIKEGVMGGDAALKTVLDLAKKADVLLMGPGLDRFDDTMELVRNVALNTPTQLVLDADAIYAFKRHADEINNIKKIPILTPHLGELATFLDMKISDLKADLINIARETAEKYRAIFAIKSECTLVAYPTGEIYAESFGNTGMATAGAGDVLAGTIAGLFKEAGEKAPILGVHIHAKAGNIAYEEYGEGLTAGNILENLGKARKELLNA
ncbi:MAG: NAD(P)H-hydrate dehydratase [Selenomonadaceae bacterium]|nr:NAD(P)H-hydrate dehydratase [Selenomonadaceae bacterium]